MTICFVSNYINHHQIPFCEEMIRLCREGDSFFFIQTQEMEEERKQMGWSAGMPDYVLSAYKSGEENAKCRKLIFDSEVVIFGGCEDESYIKPRLEDIKSAVALKAGSGSKAGPGKNNKKLTFRYSERVYKEGQWKFISPRGLAKKRADHTRYNDIPFYLLCAGGYVASDYALFGAYRDKMFKWGYFPKAETFDIDACINDKGYELRDAAQANKRVPYLIWAGRMIGWKHPENAVLTAQYLKSKGHRFQMDIFGNGPLRDKVSALINETGVRDCVSLKEFVSPPQMRELMKKADIFLMTSDRMEGWGAVANEAMNSGCCLIADCMEGAIPYLAKDGENALVYRGNGNSASGELLQKTERALTDPELRRKIAKNAYRTITEEWNAKTASERLMQVIRAFEEGKEFPEYESGPCSREIPMSERAVARNNLTARYK